MQHRIYILDSQFCIQYFFSSSFSLSRPSSSLPLPSSPPPTSAPLKHILSLSFIVQVKCEAKSELKEEEEKEEERPRTKQKLLRNIHPREEKIYI